jgi:hypothetical protein
VKHKQKLPDDEVRFLASMPPEHLPSRLRALWLSGWSLGVIAKSLKPARPKSTVHFWVKNASEQEQTRTIPTPPAKSLTSSAPLASSPRMRSISPEVPLDMVSHIQQLAQLSKLYRSKTPASSPLAQANKELTEIALDLYHRGVPAASIAQAAGVTYRAMARRIANG